MIQKQLFIILILFFAHYTSVNGQDKDIKTLYNIALGRTTGSDTIFRNQIGLPPKEVPSILNKTQQLKNYKEWRKKRQAVLDTEQIFVVVEKKIEPLPQRIIKGILPDYASNRDRFSALSKSLDTSYNEAIKQLCNQNTQMHPLRLKDLNPRYNYVICSVQDYQNYRKAHPKEELEYLIIDSTGHFHGLNSNTIMIKILTNFYYFVLV